ncbi:MAG: PAS domain S-box protein [Thermodesulfovibrionales bacterium]|nr:PAS domain S-box protein [Thermodesulfovibrionales bacterium]
MSDLFLETLRFIITAVFVLYLWRAGIKGGIHRQRGWSYILLGFSLILFGMAIDITDNFPSLNKYVIVGDTEAEAFLEKVVGSLFGFIFLGIGFYIWFPIVVKFKETQAALLGAHDELELKVEERTGELSRELDERNRIELALMKNEKFLSEVLNSIQDGISVLDKDLNILRVNSFMDSLYAHKAPLIGKKCYETYHGLAEPCDKCPTLRTLESGKKELEVVPYVTEQGVEGWLNLYTFPMIDSGTGQVEGVIEFVQDITDRMKTKQDLMESKKRLAEKSAFLDNILYSSTDMAIAATDQDFRITYYNPMAEKLFGYSAEEVIGKTVMEVHLKEKVAPERFDNAIATVKKEGSYSYKVEQQTGNGRRLIESRVTGIIDRDRRTIGYVLMSRDVTERDRAEKALRKSEALLNKAQHIAKIGHWELDIKANKLSWSDETYRIFEISPGEFGASYDAFLALLHPGDREAVDKAYNDSIKNRVPYEIIHRIIFPDKRTKFVHERCETTYDEAGAPAFSIGTVQDITEIRKAEEKLRTALSEKEVLLQELHHRVKNNMQIISSLCKLQMTHMKNEETIDALKENQDRIMSMALVHEKLYNCKSLAEIDASDYFNELVTAICNSYRIGNELIVCRVSARDIILSIDTLIPCGLIVNELVTNSLKHAFPKDRKGEILVDITKAPPDKITLTISDDGVGMPEEIDLEKTETLGFQLVNILTQQLEGRIELERKKGTTFRITVYEGTVQSTQESPSP